MSIRSAVVAVCVAVSACAAMVDMEPAQLVARAASSSATEIRLERSATVTASSGYPREIPAGSKWKAVGRVSKGDVYKRVDGVFNIEGRHFHEAYLVIEGARLQGFYLPAEEKFSPALSPVQLTLGGNP